MDAFARALLTAESILQHSDYSALRAARYASFDDGEGKRFADGGLSLSEAADIAYRDGEPSQISGKQELYEMIINEHI